MGKPGGTDQEFKWRVGGIPVLGLGLSADVYSPDLFDLMRQFAGRQSQPAYLEIFRATGTALQTVRQHFPTVPMTYHGEGLWVTEPGTPATAFFDSEVEDVCRQLTILGSPWLNHECATKQMAGYSFGTYLPPLYTTESARVVAGNIALVQARMDRMCRGSRSCGPLFLLEVAPLTYFMAGTISVPRFFRLVTELVPCGLVLDIGHLWTIYRYTAAQRCESLERFVERFLHEFPVERVVEIHVAGLAPHESASRNSLHQSDANWLDAHAAPIQPVSWAMLEQVLASPRLINLRGVALEVDTKPVDTIVDEFHEANLRFGQMIVRRTAVSSGRSEKDALQSAPQAGVRHASHEDGQRLHNDYVSYAKIVTGQQEPAGPQWQGVLDEPAGLKRYVNEYLPYEILHWGGAIAEMFPQSCRALAEAGVSLDELVPWWFRTARPVEQPYDFFLLKIDRVLGFVSERAPRILALAEREAELLRQAYAEANERVEPVMEPVR